MCESVNDYYERRSYVRVGVSQRLTLLNATFCRYSFLYDLAN